MVFGAASRLTPPRKEHRLTQLAQARLLGLPHLCHYRHILYCIQLVFTLYSHWKNDIYCTQGGAESRVPSKLRSMSSCAVIWHSKMHISALYSSCINSDTLKCPGLARWQVGGVSGAESRALSCVIGRTQLQHFLRHLPRHRRAPYELDEVSSESSLL